MDFSAQFKGKKITVMGLGLLGRGVGDAQFLAECGADLIVTDLKTEEQLAGSLQKLQGFSNIKFTLGEHKTEDFEGRDMILVAAGVPSDSPYLAHARSLGVRLVQSAALFAELSGIPMIGITGTRGKSTTTAMIAHIIETATGEPVIKGGNVRGVSNLQLLREVKEGSLAVFELDSWQLQGFGWAEISPQVAVFTTFMDDHLNYYKGDINAYFADKANIFINQEESGVLVTTPEVFGKVKEFARGKDITLGQEVVLVDSSIIPEDAILSQPGEHNRLNAALAVAACRASGLADDEIFEAFASFPGVEGRLQLLATTSNGVKIYNDNNATTPQATVAGLEAVGRGKNVILIAGGADKNINVASLAFAISQYCKNAILLAGSGTEKLTPLLHGGSVGVSIFADLETAVNEAIRLATSGDVVLFSPGFASFGLFKNEYDRNDQFVSLVKKYES
jgi:UDP-N-acetylmuramoylalanine--D-glutamate ligase